MIFSFCRPTDPNFFVVLPVDQKINLVSPWRNSMVLPKNKMNEKNKILFPLPSFSDISYTFLWHFFSQKLFICFHLSLYIHTVQNNTILSSFNITYWKLDIFLVKVQSASCWWNTKPLILNKFENHYK